MDKYIARENIKRFRQQLRASSADGQKVVLRALIDAEEQKLETILKAKLPR